MKSCTIVELDLDGVTTKRVAKVCEVLPGSSGSLLVADESNDWWVMKPAWNSSFVRHCINDLLGTRIAQWLGLTVLSPAVLHCDLRTLSVAYRPTCATMQSPSETLHFGSRYLPGLPGRKRESCLGEFHPSLVNEHEIAGINLLDAWLCNTDVRQIIYKRPRCSGPYKAHWIDFGHCFAGDRWRILPSTAAANVKLRVQTGIEDWLERLWSLEPKVIYEIVLALPATWLYGREAELISLAGAICQSAQNYAPLLRTVQCDRARNDYLSKMREKSYLVHPFRNVV